MRPHLLNWFSMFARARARSNWYKRSRNELIAPVIKPGVSGTCTAIETNQFSNPSRNNPKKHSVRVFNPYFESNRNVWYTRIKTMKSFINWLLIHSFTSSRSRDIQKISCYMVAPLCISVYCCFQVNLGLFFLLNNTKFAWFDTSMGEIHI